jgi:hypothetical protein
MSKRRRGMSLEEKRQVMLDILQDSKSPFLLKELEKVGGKRGVGKLDAKQSVHLCRQLSFSSVIQSIKDVLQSLVDDGIVDLEKIGIQNFYWAFPSKELVSVRMLPKAKKSRLQFTIDAQLKTKEDVASARLAAAKAEHLVLQSTLKQLRSARLESVCFSLWVKFESQNLTKFVFVPQTQRSSKLARLTSLTSSKARLLEQVRKRRRIVGLT